MPCILSQTFTLTAQSEISRLGRGAPIVNNPGNARFRNLIIADREQYISTSRHVVKEEIARKILNAVEEKGGRFLRKIESDSERRRYNVAEGQNAWVEASDAISIQKVKQALREHKSGEPRMRKRKQSSPGSEVLEKQQKPASKETPTATEVAVAVTTDAKRSIPVAAAPGSGFYMLAQGHSQGGTASYSPSLRGRFSGPPTRDDYSHFYLGHSQLLHPQHGQVPQQMPPVYPHPDPEGMEPYSYPSRFNPYYSGAGGPDVDVASARRHQAMYSMMDSHTRAYRTASIRAAVEAGSTRDRLMRPELIQPPPGQLQARGPPFVSPLGHHQPYPYDTRYSLHQAHNSMDSGGYAPYYAMPNTYDTFELPGELRANHEYNMGRQPPPPLTRYGHDQLTFPPITDQQQEAKSGDVGQQSGGFDEERSRSTSSLSAADSEANKHGERKA